jgi:hypothetical protein
MAGLTNIVAWHDATTLAGKRKRRIYQVATSVANF